VLDHVKRMANEATHRLAKEALRNTSEKAWIEEIPNTILDVVTLLKKFVGLTHLIKPVLQERVAHSL
jgi:hypothetical protein